MAVQRWVMTYGHAMLGYDLWPCNVGLRLMVMQCWVMTYGHVTLGYDLWPCNVGLWPCSLIRVKSLYLYYVYEKHFFSNYS